MPIHGDLVKSPWYVRTDVGDLWPRGEGSAALDARDGGPACRTDSEQSTRLTPRGEVWLSVRCRAPQGTQSGASSPP